MTRQEMETGQKPNLTSPLCDSYCIKEDANEELLI